VDSDAETLPVERIATPPEADFTRARNVNETKLDNGFDGWARHATIRWPHAGLQLDLEASPVFGHAVIYVPPGRAYFCVEPVSHATARSATPISTPGQRSPARSSFGFQKNKMRKHHAVFCFLSQPQG